MQTKVELPVEVLENNQQWKLYTFEFSTQEGKFSSYFYATSMLHAACILEEMKNTAELSGEILGVV